MDCEQVVKGTVLLAILVGLSSHLHCKQTTPEISFDRPAFHMKRHWRRETPCVWVLLSLCCSQVDWWMCNYQACYSSSLCVCCMVTHINPPKDLCSFCWLLVQQVRIWTLNMLVTSPWCYPFVWYIFHKTSDNIKMIIILFYHEK